ncbi:MAG: DUF1800 domain-containing protein [Bacteroidota bacterium]
MNRRALLSGMLGQRQQDIELPTTVAALLPVNAGLEPYSGTWDFEQAAHLLRRTMYGPTFEQMKAAAQMGMEEVVSTLLEDLPLPEPPLNDNPDDPIVRMWETWVDRATPRGNPDAINKRRWSLRAWMIQQFVEEGMNVREKMTVFWMDHFVVELFITRDPTFMYKHITLMREYATGDFRELVKKATLSPSMLRYLNGNQNDKNAPNENYARELLELFTVGKGDLAGEGDYTTFTEQDVEEAAKALTGWRDEGYYKETDNARTGATFYPNRHDTSTKQLSHRFDNATITNRGDEEYAYLIDILLESPYAATFISEKLYRYFVYYKIDDQVRQNIIEPMAQILRDNDYNIKPVLETLLKSQHFYDILNMGPMIKNPTDFIMGLLKQFHIKFDDDPARRYVQLRKMYSFMEDMQMELFDPPDVAGWKAYYQEPLYYRIWINSVTLPERVTLSNALTLRGLAVRSSRLRVDVLTFVETVGDATNPNSVVGDFAKLMFPRPLSQGQFDALKDILIPGLPDFEWTIEYEQYKSNPNDNKLKRSIENKLRDLLNAMVNMPEYYLS